MYILKVTNNGQVQQSDFSTQEECVAHFEKYKALGFWGKDEFSTNYPEVLIDHIEIPEVVGVQYQAEVLEVKDVQGNITTPYQAEVLAVEPVTYQAAYTETIPAYVVVTPCEYTVEIIDNSTQEAQELIKKQIAALEEQITSRRVREAVLSGDHSFLQSIDAQITILRTSLL